MCVHGIEETRTRGNENLRKRELEETIAWGNENLGKHATLHATPVIQETHRAKVAILWLIV